MGSMSLHLQSQLTPPRGVVRVSGEVEISNADTVKAEVLRVSTGGCPEVTIDLSNVSFIDSFALGMLSECHRTVEDLGGSLRIVTSPTVQRMLEITGLDRVLTIVGAG